MEDSNEDLSLLINFNQDGTIDLTKGKRRRKKKRHDPDEEGAFLHDRLMSALVITESTDLSMLTDDIKTQFGDKNPVSMLTEMVQYLRATLNFVEVGIPKGPSHSPKFTMNAVVDGIPYRRVTAGSKKECRTGAAYLAYKEILHNEQQKFRDICSMNNTGFDELVAALSHLEYLKIVEKNPSAFCGRKILATFLIKRKLKKGKKDTIRVLSLATGNRCIHSQHLTTKGDVVHDSHAEIIARRALVRYLLKELENFKPSNPDSILEQSSTGKAKLKSSVSLHLYISTAPCGDAAIYSRTEREFQNCEGPLFLSTSHGQLRTKIESGEGCIPVSDIEEFSPTIVSIQFGKRLRTMSCSDKICKWNVLGLQGALLSQLLDPVYLSSITIGNNYVSGHILRALNCRLGKDKAQYKPSLYLHFPYKISTPDIGHSELDEGLKETETTSATCVAWSCSADKPDVFDGVCGRAVEGPEDQRTPAITKKKIFRDFKRLCTKLKRPELIKESYFATKQDAFEYQRAKGAFLERLEELGYGKWVKKPPETEYFY